MSILKNVVFKSAFAFILLIGITSCDGCKPEPEPKPETEPDRPAQLYRTGILLPDQAKTLFDAYEKRRVTIIQDFEDAFDEEYPDYRTKNPSQNGELGGKGDSSDPNGEQFDVARYVYYDYQDIKDYLEYIENEAALSGETISTLRFYFGNYDETIADSIKHPRQNTIMISPTIKRNDRENIFFTIDAKEDKREAVVIGDYFTKEDSATGGKTRQIEQNDKNKASLVPNPFSFTPALEAPMFAPRGTTKNEGNSAPPPHANQ